jgi:predicted HTH domain antitoxin
MAASCTLELPAGLLEAARITADDAKLELALALFARAKLSLGKAAELAGLSVADFQLQMGLRKLPPHYGVDDAADDAAVFASFRSA